MLLDAVLLYRLMRFCKSPSVTPNQMKRLLPNICSLIFALLWLCASGAWADVPPGYYNDAVGKKKAELKAAMHEIIGYAKVLGYGSGEGHTWEGFNQTDRRSDNSVIDRYSKEVFYFPANYGAPKGMNIEHSFPKSWWGGSSNQAYKDIHHLMPCEANINSRKSNYPIGIVTGADSGNGYTKVGTGSGGKGQIKLWEPADEWKGDFARAYFYMATCYSNLTWQGDEALKQLENNEWPTLQQWTYELLLKWNSEDPVDDFERTRNDKVFSIQGNRNPFIDFPDLAEYIWGSKTDVAWNIDGTIIDPDDPPAGNDVISAYPFETAYEPFVAVSAEGASAANVWKTNASYKCAVANAFAGGNAQASDAYLVSPEIDLTGYKSAEVAFDHATGFNKSADASTMFSVVVTEDVQDALSPNHADWDELAIPTWPAQTDKSYTSFVNSGAIDLSAYCGKTIRLAFRYQSTTSNCWAWEVRNVVFSGEKSDATKIFDKWYADYTSPKQQVYTVSGMFVGNDVPEEHGIYIVREKNRTIKVMK